MAYKDLDNDDPSNDNPSQLGYYRVSKRWDEVEPGVQINVSEFAYVDWDTATNRSRTTRTPRRGTDDPGVPPAVEVWEFNQEHELIAYEVTGQSSGASRDQVEKRRTEYQLCGQLPIRETTTITLGGYSRQEVVVNTWDEVGNLLSTTNPAGQITEYTYDPTYNLLTSQLERTSTLTEEGRVIAYALDPTRKLVEEKTLGMARKVTTTNSFSGSPSDFLYPGWTWNWTPQGAITSVNLDVRWYLAWSDSWQTYEVDYTVSYRAVGTSNWITAVSKRHSDGYAYEGSDSIEFSVPLGEYEIRLEVSAGEWVVVQSANAEGTVSRWEYLGPTTRTVFTYDPNYPGNLASVVTYSFDGTEESRTTYTYDLTWHAYPARIETVTTSGLLATEARYDVLGRVSEYTSQDGLTRSTANYRYDRLGRLIEATLPSQEALAGAFRPTRTWFYDVQAGGDGPSRGVFWYVIRRDQIDTLPGQAQPSYQWVREGFDKLGRFKEATWGKGGADLASVIWAGPPKITVSYNSVGQIKSETDALGHTTSHAYDAFGSKISTLYPGQTEATEQSWYVVSGPPPVTTPAIPLNPPGDPSKFAWVRWEKSQDADQHPIYRGYDVAGRLVWSAANPKDNQNPVVQPVPVVKTETTGDDFGKGTLANVSRGWTPSFGHRVGAF